MTYTEVGGFFSVLHRGEGSLLLNGCVGRGLDCCGMCIGWRCVHTPTLHRNHWRLSYAFIQFPKDMGGCREGGDFASRPLFLSLFFYISASLAVNMGFHDSINHSLFIVLLVY